jgi:alpha-glucosidase
LKDHAWWQHGIVYQIYPRSFQDSNGDGIGDLAGILERLDYLVWLGVTSVWISPFYTSPMADFGYDVMDYEGVDPIFGELADFDRLVAEMHRRDLKLILDSVPNHTSDRHPWFIESRSSRLHPKRNWYVWRDPAPGGGPPSNWLSEFGGSAWTLDAATGQYYYHAFLAEQPDLNWREPEVERALHDVLRFWLERGVDGFRVDAIHMLVEDEELRDNPPNPTWREGMSPARRLIRVHTTDHPLTHDLITGMRRVADEFEDRVLIGEAYLPIDRLMLYYGERLRGFHLPFNFHLLSTPWNAQAIAELVRQYEAALPPGAWPNWVLGNHDRPRIASARSDAAAHAARHPDPVLRRRDRHARRARSAGTHAGHVGKERAGFRTRPVPHADAMGPDGRRGLLARDAMAAAHCGFRDRQRRSTTRRLRVAARALPRSDPSTRQRASIGGRWL